MQTSLPDVLSYYQAVIPYIVASFHDVPFAWNLYPNGGSTPLWRGPVRTRRLPTVDVVSASGPKRYFKLEPFTLEWLAKDHGAVEFHSWTPTRENPLAARYARILLEPGNGVLTADAVRDAALLMRAMLRARSLDAIPLLDGTGGVALYVPFADAPKYPELRRWLYAIANGAAIRHPNNFTTEPNSAGGTRVHVHVKSNAPGLHSALPYSVRGPDARFAVAPVTWDELAARARDALRLTIEEVRERLNVHGDVFAEQSAKIGTQHFAGLAASPQVMVAYTQPRGHVIRAAIEILSDGHSRDAQTILHDAVARGLLTNATSEKYVYVALTEYIARSKGHDRKSPIVQNPDRSFRVNEPLDDWPDVTLPPIPAPDDATAALIARLQKTVSGDDPAAWEVAVCDAFAHLGFRATHIGGHMAPDGTIDAQLGPLGYRAMLECKSGHGVVTQPDAVEASKFASQYNAQYCTLIGPGFSEEVELHSELLTHKVSAWTIDDLVTALRERLDPLALQPCFAPGFAEDQMIDVLWERAHGERKRIAYAAHVIAEEGYAAQIAAAAQADPQNAAHLTIDAAMLLVQQNLTSAGATRACTREEIAAAFTHLTDPISGSAVWLDPTHSAIVLFERHSER